MWENFLYFVPYFPFMRQSLLFIVGAVYALGLSAQGYHYLPFKQYYRWGLMNERNEIIAPAKYDSIGFFENKRGMVAVYKGKYGILNPTGKKVKWAIKPKYSYIVDTCNFLILNTPDESLYLTDSLTKPQLFFDDYYQHLDCPSEEPEPAIRPGGGETLRSLDKFNVFYLIRTNEKAEKINKSTFIQYEGKGIPPVLLNDYRQKGLVSYTFKVDKKEDKTIWAKVVADTIPPMYDSLVLNLLDPLPVTSNLKTQYPKKISCVLAKKKGKWGLITTRNELILPFEYDYIQTTDNAQTTYLLLRKTNLWGWYNRKNLQCFTPKYSALRSVHTKNKKEMFWWAVRPDGKAGYVRIEDGKEFIETVKKP